MVVTALRFFLGWHRKKTRISELLTAKFAKFPCRLFPIGSMDWYIYRSMNGSFWWDQCREICMPVPWMRHGYRYMNVSENSGTPKSSILIGFSIINHAFWGTPIFGNIHIYQSNGYVMGVLPRSSWTHRRLPAPCLQVRQGGSGSHHPASVAAGLPLRFSGATGIPRTGAPLIHGRSTYLP